MKAFCLLFSAVMADGRSLDWVIAARRDKGHPDRGVPSCRFRVLQTRNEPGRMMMKVDPNSSDEQLINALAYTRWMAPIRDELIRRANNAGFGSDIYAYLRNPNQTTLKLVEDQSQPTLRAELTEILNSGWDFTGVNYPNEGREFCSEAGRVVSKREADLTPKQSVLLAVIRKHYRRWLVDTRMREGSV